MNILSIETSCDETAVSIIETVGDFPNATYKILGNSLFSQIDIHREYGGVFPAVAKREHARTLVPMLERALQEAKLLKVHATALSQKQTEHLCEILFREPGLADLLTNFFEKNAKPNIDLIAVTSGPGLEPALWVGINFARALSYFWNIPVVPVNHMEGHILSSIFDGAKIQPISFPALGLLISGGHTELVLMKEWASYERVGETLDDAVGEAFDKVARMLGLPYPGGPEIGSRAQRARVKNLPSFIILPRPMLDKPNLNFSFSGLKTAVRYAIGERKLSSDETDALARDFEDSVTEVLLKKTQRAIDKFGVQTLIVGGGVSANTYIRKSFTTHFKKEYPELAIHFPPHHLSTDNSIMIALAGHAQAKHGLTHEIFGNVKANGNLSLSVLE
ncbi:MAG: tRNA (adenosine(37)-N6)-threonylcarbamoyltransferase complex transferase subunit TsaD [Candidatus Pacebacteria bacterium]|nr:tRNA (adenosine(37)-N6)-threonylcarbamoyltransferase complex transferase subunit TsaD [Candidatus Paceibacterota bacterium]MCF7857587.1 tRNA (adenosine(37)-N6)-threonylcarbamoyltransferase complex transferase subunit TsaD [Candidatus Paceibacterota bacterium]